MIKIFERPYLLYFWMSQIERYIFWKRRKSSSCLPSFVKIGRVRLFDLELWRSILDAILNVTVRDYDFWYKLILFYICTNFYQNWRGPPFWWPLITSMTLNFDLRYLLWFRMSRIQTYIFWKRRKSSASVPNFMRIWGDRECAPERECARQTQLLNVLYMGAVPAL